MALLLGDNLKIAVNDLVSLTALSFYTILPQLESQLREKEREIDNIVTAIQQGVASRALMQRLNEIEKQKTDIETAITKEQIKAPTYPLYEYRMALCK